MKSTAPDTVSAGEVSSVSGGATPVYAVVLNWNGLEDTCACVASLERVTDPPLRIVIVDNGSSDGSGETLAREFSRHTVLLRPDNGGYAAGNNTGIRHALDAGAEFVLVLNNDTTVDPGFLAPMLDTARRDPAVGIVTCAAFLSDEPGRQYGTGGPFSRWRTAGMLLPPGERGRSRAVEFISGCVMLVRREVFETSGLLDESFFMYYEDLEFSRRVARRWTLWYEPAGVIRHKSGGGSRWLRQTPLYFYYMTRNRILAFRGDPFAYRAYVLLYTFVNVLVKTAVSLFAWLSSRRRRYAMERISALWRGFRDGLQRRSGFVPAARQPDAEGVAA